MKVKSIWIVIGLVGNGIFFGCKEKVVSSEMTKETTERVEDTSSLNKQDKPDEPLNHTEKELTSVENQSNSEEAAGKQKSSSIEVPKTQPQEEIRPAPKPEKIESLDPVQYEEAKKNTKPEPEKPKVKKANPAVYQQLLSKYVSSSGLVQYRELKNDLAQLESYTQALADDPTFISGTHDEKLALWINTYNAYTLLMVVKHYPIYSLRKIYDGKPWDVAWIRIGSKTYSLNQIENDIIRPQFNEPRIHFVLNCAAMSCPPLQNEVITANNLESILERATKNFINGKSNSLQENTLFLSPIFDWYRSDFGDVLTFVKKYSAKGINPDVKIQFLPYDWTLNKE